MSLELNFELPRFSQDERILKVIIEREQVLNESDAHDFDNLYNSFEYPLYTDLYPIIGHTLVNLDSINDLSSALFRPDEAYWHLDAISPYDKSTVNMLGSSTPTEFAACTVAIGSIKRAPILPRRRRALEHAKMFELIDLLPSKDWIGVASGLVDDHETEETLDKLQLSVSDVNIVQSLPYTIASGKVIKTLHRSALRHPDSPDTRTFIRWFRNK